MIDMGTATQRLCIHEGIRLKPYRCSAGYLTIGVGRNLETNPLSAEEKEKVGDVNNGITKDAAFYLLRNDIKRVEKECAQHIPFWRHLDDERQYARLVKVQKDAFRNGYRQLSRRRQRVLKLKIRARCRQTSRKNC